MMLVQSAVARRNLGLHRLLSSTSLQIVSTCPPSTRRCGASSASRRLLSTRQTLRPWKRKPSLGLVGSERHLATALDYRPGAPIDIPFENLTSDYSDFQKRHALYDLKPVEVTVPLIIQPLEPQVRGRVNVHGIPGGIDELLCLFDASMRVGKLDRATMYLKRLNVMGQGVLSPVDLLELHNRYLYSRLERMEDGLDDNGEDLHRWFELEIQGKDMPITAETIALMLKGALLAVPKQKNARVQRYMGLLDTETAMDTLSEALMSGLLTTQDMKEIVAICPEYNLPDNPTPMLLDEGSPGLQSDEDVPSGPAQTASPVDEVQPTFQKGMGLSILKQALSMFSGLPNGHDVASLSLKQRREVQSRLEKDCLDAAVARWREENQALLDMGLNSALSHASFKSKLYEWQQALEARIVEELAKLDASELVAKKTTQDIERCVYGPLMRLSTPSRLAATTILSTLSSLAMFGATKGVPLSTIVSHVGKVVEEDIQMQSRDKENPQSKSKGRKANARQLMRRFEQQRTGTGPTDATPGSAVTEPSMSRQPWPQSIRMKVGCALLQCLLESAKVKVVREHPETQALVTQIQPAFSHVAQLRRGRKVGTITANRVVVDDMLQEPSGNLLARHLPMVVEPEPWSRFDKGGFLESSVSLLRVKHGEKDQKIYADAAIARGDMNEVFKGLDVLGKTAWKINRPVFNVLLAAWNSGKEVANIPPLEYTMNIPPEPSTNDPTEKRLWYRAVKLAENEKSGLHSERCFINFQLEIARAFRDQTFYFPHNVDFRGRAYPIPAYLNHMGADHVRGLLVFAKGKALGANGLRWLKIQLANVFGYDKASLAEREEFTMNNMDNIRDSVTNGLDGKRWWLKAEDPWQCLAACHELIAALDSPDPTKFISHLPVHQDGTCNGLQHYAALGGDVWGAQQVNLIPGDRPADVYTAVAKLVEGYIAEDLERGNPYAKFLQGKISRKVVKQTVMTNVYGVTFVGAKKQVVKQLDSLYPDLSEESGIDPIFHASYIATNIFKALSTMFKGAHELQSWLGEICVRVCHSVMPYQIEELEAAFKASAEELGNSSENWMDQMEQLKGKRGRKKATDQASDKPGKVSNDVASLFRSSIVWTTPLRMPVVQPYRKTSSKPIETCLQFLNLNTPESSDAVNARKQLQAFPPNFIHSLDASHMLLSALSCDKLGLTFAAVHDSFWTHAADIDSMSSVLRDAFVRIHREDVIGRLRVEFEARYRGAMYLVKIKSDSVAGKKIKSFRHQKKYGLKTELVLENQRQRLLKSLDPEEVRKGREMVTAASIFEELSTEDDVIATPEDEEVDVKAAPLLAEEDMLEKDADDMEDAVDGASDAESTMEALTSKQTLSHFDQKVTTVQRGEQKKRQRAPQTIQLWVPLTFPPVPKKGDFDVKTLKESKYFFH
ncbi:hypothetical protein B0H66DRAFT_227040 [Apodospora peruviana]|uniref:DNA-directed RNA polymerase n=1 Tax=Apodospora peruviana TaxID=516989 RepID=A0AAE0I4C8_9PEZI|nr:hypothetical protein B0H66DRAFT_227040 [Apodospora peruviana]